MDRAYFRLLVQAVVDGLSDRHADLMFDVLDIDRSGAITIAEFLRLPAVLALKFPHQLSRTLAHCSQVQAPLIST